MSVLPDNSGKYLPLNGDLLLTADEYLAQGHLDKAISLYLEILEVEPQQAIAHWRIGDIYIQQGRQVEAIFHKQRAIELKPDLLSAKAHNMLGANLAQQGNFDAAIASFQRATLVQPDYADAYYNMGNVFSAQQIWDRAIANYEKVLSLDPYYASAYLNLGAILTQQHRQSEAIHYYQRAIEAIPQFAEAHFALGSLWFNLERLDESILCFENALQVQPNYAEAAYALGAALSLKKQLDQATTWFRQALALKPDYAEAYAGLGKALAEQWQIDEAIACYQKALSIQPNLAQAQMIYQLMGFIHVYLFSGNSQAALDKFLELEQLVYQNINKLTAADITALYTSMLFITPHLRDDLIANAELGKAIGQLYTKKVLHLQPVSISKGRTRTKKASKPLRIGFLSPNFRRHAVGWLCYDIIQELSAITSEIFLYATGQTHWDDRTHLFAHTIHRFYQPQDSSRSISTEISEQIYQDSIDVLIDLDSLTTKINIEVLSSTTVVGATNQNNNLSQAYKVPPIGMTWLGWDAPYASSHNYFLCDWHTHPEGMNKFYREKLLRMPGSFIAVANLEVSSINRDEARQAINIKPDVVAYLSIVSGRKINPQLVKAQVEIVKRVPESVLIHRGIGEMAVFQSLYRQECEVQGVDFSRFIFQGTVSPEEVHRRIYLISDVILDSYPFNGGTISLEALYFNLPLVTLTGQQFFARMGYSFLQTLGIQAGIAYNWKEYIDWGVRFGIDHEFRLSIKNRLIQSKQAETLSPLWNPQQFAKEMYSIFEELMA